ncbi:MAG: IPT/TIG domain-containing protein [Candidatus Obscuribacterales bacterium]|nr:IPT/TIG domain-containing protein [Candidatus Obscuribacterales bacterium]
MQSRRTQDLKTTLSATVLLISSAFFIPPVLAESNVTISNEASDGLKTVVFSAPAGTVLVNFPDDMQAGDRVSGTVTAKPKANSAEELAHSALELSSYRLELEQAEPLSTRPWQQNAKTENGLSAAVECTNLRRFAFQVPAAGKQLKLKLLAKDGAVMASQEIQVGEATKDSAVNAAGITLPESGESGQKLRIKGSFGPDSKVLIGSENCSIVAESPRQLIFITPLRVSGKTKIECRAAAGKQLSSKFNNRPSGNKKPDDLLDMSGVWSGSHGSITITQSGPFVTWDSGSIRAWGTVSKDALDFDFHNYRYECLGKGHLVKTKTIGFKTYLDGYFQKTSVNNKAVSYPKHAFHLFRR